MTPDSNLNPSNVPGMKAMATKTFEIQGLFGALDHLAIAKKLQRFPGVSSVNVNAASTTASVTYDETTAAPEHVMHTIGEWGFHYWQMIFMKEN